SEGRQGASGVRACHCKRRFVGAKGGSESPGLVCLNPGPTFQPGFVASPSVSYPPTSKGLTRTLSLKSSAGPKPASTLPIRIEPAGGQKSGCAGLVNAEGRAAAGNEA